MPLRSVEAATRDDAIAAAREQFGPSARVVGVRRVRSGGVLGFFATERYVAEVAPDPIGVPGVPLPVPARPAGALTEDPDTGSLAAYGSPLTSAAPARARTAPPRNGAAAWAAEAARSSTPAARSTPELVASGAGRRTATARPLPADDARVEEMASLLGAPIGPPPEPAAVPAPQPAGRPGVARASFPRAVRETPAPASAPASGGDAAGDRADAAAPTGAPSPFTAALARMVAGDREVQHAVREALETSDAARTADEQRGVGASQPGSQATSRASVWSRATSQEEETVGDQVIAPPSTSVEDEAVSSSWADAPSFAGGSSGSGSFPGGWSVDEPADVAAPVSPSSPVSREEAIAEVLRAALAEGHSDDALAGILRKVVAGDSPETALAEPTGADVPVAGTEAPSTAVTLPEPELPETELPETMPAEAALPETMPAEAVPTETVPAAAGDAAVPVVEAPVVEAPVAEAPVAEAPVAEAPVAEVPVAEVPVARPGIDAFDLFAPVAPRTGTAAPAPVPSSPVELWGEPSAPAPAPRPEVPVATSVADIWAELAPVEPAPIEAPSSPVPPVGSRADEAAADESIALPETGTAEPSTDTAEPEAEVEVQVGSPIDELTAAEAVVEEPVVTETLTAEAVTGEAGSALDLELAPVLARTASDPAPLDRSLAMDATTVMPPLSLLPGSPSRGRGLPPVPPRTGRPPVPPSRGAAASSSGAGTGAPASSARTPELLATVTRLPVAPLMATPGTPDMPELAELADLIEADGSGLLDSPALPVAVPPRPTRVRIAPPSTPAEVVSRLADLGVRADLLGPAFLADVESDGTYAALTRALGDRLPDAPELPAGAGDVLFVVGPGVETLRAARSLAATLRLDPDRVQWATRGDLVGLAPETSRMSTIDTALRRRQDALATGTVTIVAVDAPLRTDAYWMAQLLAIWSPVAVWAVVEATRKPEDLEHWIDGLARVDALIVQDTDLSADPAAVLHRLAAPVAVVDGVRATPHRWASVLCERLESAPA